MSCTQTIMVQKYREGRVCFEHEKIIKSRYMPHSDKDRLPDGYTETVGEGDIMDLFKDMTELYGGVESGGSRTNPFGS